MISSQEGEEITVHGGATLARPLMRHDLVDHYRFLVSPVVVGDGKRLFSEGDAATLKILNLQTFDSGVVALVYAPNRE